MAAMEDSFIPGSFEHSEALVGGPSFDSHPAHPPVLAISPHIATDATFQASISFPDVRLPIHEFPTC